MLPTLVDRIYEAAFIPDYWEAVIADIVQLSGSAAGSMLLVDPRLPPLWSSTSNTHEQLSAYAQTDGWYTNPRMVRLLRRDYAGFVRDIDVSTPEEVAADLHVEFMHRAGIDHQAATGVVMPTGELVMFTVERAIGVSHYRDEDIAALDALRPHLARASFTAARLALQQAQSTVETLQMLGLPAAVLAANGIVLASNTLLETEASFFKPAAFGKIFIEDRQANALLQEALAVRPDEATGVRSVPVRALEPGRAPAVIHLVPVRRAANDIFGAGSTLIVVTSYAASGMVPADAILKGLFDLSAAEAKLAAALSSGQSLSEAARSRDITLPTARTQLGQIFLKTGTHQQSELVALLKSAPSL